MYSSSITKTPAARYTVEGIKDMIPTLAMINRNSKHVVFSTMIILSVVSVKIEKRFGYGYLEEIVVRRADQKLYKFKEGDFSDLHLNDIEDMLLLIAQNKLFNLDGDVIVDFVTTLKMFTRGIIIKNRVKDVQLVKEPYTLNYDPPGIIYEDKSKKKRPMRVDEIHKFCDGTLQSVRKTLCERLLNFKFGYNKDMPLREWTTKDKKCTGIMLNKMDDLLFKRRVLRSLEVLIGGMKNINEQTTIAEDNRHHGPSDAMHNLPYPLKVSQKNLVSFLTEINAFLSTFSLREAARREKLVPSADRVKISATNMRIDPTVPQKEETFQVILDIIKASPCFKAFTITADVPEIYMQQFWFTVKKRKKTSFYEFGLDVKKFTMDVEVFREILDICPRVPNEDFVAPSSEEVLLAFLIELGYKGLLDHLARMFVDHMHQPCRTLATIINKSLSGKTSNNDRLHQSRVSILWGGKSCPILDLPKSSSITSSYSTLPFPKDQALQSEAYQTFIKYSIGLIPLKKRRGKGTQGKKLVVTLNPVSVEVFYEFDLKPGKRQTGRRRKFIKKVSISVDDNIIPEPDVSLELGKPMSITEAEEEEAARQVHATHERIVMESNHEPARRSTRRRPSGIAFRDNLSVSKKKSPDQSQKLKGIQTLTVKEQLAANTMQALKASINSSRSQPHTGGSSEGTVVSLRVPDDSTIILATSSEGTEEESEYSKEETVNEEVEWLYSDEEEEKKDDDDEDGRIIDIEKTGDEETDDEFVHCDEYVHDDVDEEINDVEDTKTGKDEEEITDAEKTKVTKGDLEQAGKLSLIRSSLSVSFGFDNQFLNLSYDTSLIGTIKESADTSINSLLDIQIQQEVPHIQSPSILIVPVLVILDPTVLSTIPKIPLVTPATTPPPPPSISTITLVLHQTTTPIPAPPITTIAPAATIVPDPLPTIAQRVSILEKYVHELKQVDHSTEILTSIRSHVPAAINEYLGSSLGDSLQKLLQKHTKELKHELKQQESHKSSSEIIKIKQEHASKKNWPNNSSTPFDKTAENEYKQKDILFKMMLAFKSFKNIAVIGPVKEAAHEVSMDEEEPVQENVNDANQPQDGEAAPKNTGSNTLQGLLLQIQNRTSNRLKLDKITKADLVGPIYNLLKGTCQSSIELEYNMEECNPGHLTIAAEYFFNNDMKYLKSTDSERKYTTSITKTKAARYELLGIEDMIPKLWSVTKVGYDKNVAFRIKHWGPKHQQFYRAQLNIFSKHNVYSPMKILSVVSVKVNKLNGYGYLEKIIVRRADQQKYKFKEGDFVNLHLNDIEDMPLLVVQHKLFHLDGEVIVDLTVALHMFTRNLIIKNRVKDVQIGVESYQKKLNITKPQKYFPRIFAKELYTPSFEPPGVVYKDLSHRKRLMRAYELYKRKWSAIDQKWSGIMVDLIDKQMLERQILRNLKRLVGARELEMDYRLMQRTVHIKMEIPWCSRVKIITACSYSSNTYVEIMKGQAKEVDINKKTENRAKMTKLSMEWKRLCKIKAKVQKNQSQSQYRRISSQTEAGTEEY
ncbi:hypothetical protein Tco_1200451 [Tanacetum coccineum]